MKTIISTLTLFFIISSIFAQHETKLTSPDGRNGDRFGAAVAITGDICIIGEPNNTAWPYVERGTVYSFKKILKLIIGKWLII